MRDLRGRLRPEARFLFDTARPGPPAVPPELRWLLLERLAAREMAIAVVRDRIAHLPPGLVPRDVVQRLDAAALVSEFRMRCVEASLHEAVHALADAGVAVLLLKGAALGCTVHGGVRARPMRDLDLLVPADQGDRAWRALLAAGWERDYPASMDVFYACHQHFPPLKHPRQAGVALELHTGLVHGGGPFALTPDDLFRDAGTVVLDGCRVAVPSAAHLLVHLGVHFAWGHTFSRGVFRAMTDLAALCRTPAAADRFVEIAREARAGTCCYWTLRLGRQLLGLSFPEDWLAALRPPLPDRLLDVLERHIAGLSGLLGTPCPSVRLKRALWNLAVQPGASGHGPVRPWAAGLEWGMHGAGNPEVEARKAPDPPRARLADVWHYATGLLSPR